MENKINHSERAHALLSASGASRWLNCTPSACLEDEYGEHKSSPYAAEGTLAHELAELYLQRDVLRTISEETFNEKLEEIMSNELFNDEMLEMVPIYTDYCVNQLLEARKDNVFAVMELEQCLDFTEYVPESFGTADCCIVNDKVLEVIDLKYGKGVPVSPEWNPQLMLYGLGALHKYDMTYDIEEVHLTIVQPRLDNISTFKISVQSLLEWADNELKPRAWQAFRGEGDLNTGGWCRFCSVKNRCRLLAQKQLELAKHEFKEAPLLTDDEIADIILRTPKLVEWAKGIVEYAQDQAINHDKHWPGLKLVEGVSRRKWRNEDEAANIILQSLPISEDQLYTMELKTITEVEKLLGKKAFGLIADMVCIKPAGKPTLVPLDDKRPAMGIEQAKLDFAE